MGTTKGGWLMAGDSEAKIALDKIVDRHNIKIVTPLLSSVLTSSLYHAWVDPEGDLPSDTLAGNEARLAFERGKSYEYE